MYTQESMKVLQINATYANGSTGTIVQDIQQCCEEWEIECHVAYAISRVSKAKIKNGYKIGNFVSNKLHALLSRFCGQQAYFSYLPTLAFLHYMSRLKPDVVHLHNLHSNYINLNMLLRYLANYNIPTVVTLHDCWFYTGGCFHYTNVRCDKWQHGCGHCPKQRQDTPAYLCDKSASILRDRYRYFSKIKNLTVVGVSRWVTEECQKSVFKNVPCQTIYNGIDTDVFKPTPSNMRERYGLVGKFVILGPASKWLNEVNKDVFQTVVANLDKNSVLVLFGHTGENVQLLPNVITIGYTSSKEELAQLYSMADVFVNCTREESLSCINLEAQACGTPVITFSNTGATETVDGINSIKIRTGNANELLKALGEIKNSPSNAEEELLAWIDQRFEKNKNFEKYIHLYHQVIKSHRQY